MNIGVFARSRHQTVKLCGATRGSLRLKSCEFHLDQAYPASLCSPSSCGPKCYDGLLSPHPSVLIWHRNTSPWKLLLLRLRSLNYRTPPAPPVLTFRNIQRPKHVHGASGWKMSYSKSSNILSFWSATRPPHTTDRIFRGIDRTVLRPVTPATKHIVFLHSD